MVSWFQGRRNGDYASIRVSPPRARTEGILVEVQPATWIVCWSCWEDHAEEIEWAIGQFADVLAELGSHSSPTEI